MKSTRKAVSDIQGKVRLVEASGAFDKAFYLKQLAERKEKKSSPIKHYLLQGWKNGYDPHPCFDTKFYLESNEDVRQLNLHPFLHFIMFGFNEARYIKKGFYLPDYKNFHPEVAAEKINPLTHFSKYYGRKFITFELLETKHRQTVPTTLQASFEQEGKQVGYAKSSTGEATHLSEIELVYLEVVRASALFDEEYYSSNNKDLDTCDSAIEHYLLFGGREGRAASEDFDSRTYLERNDDVANSELNPLVHYELFGQHEGRQKYPVSAAKPGSNLLDNPIDLINSSTLFNAQHYLDRYPEVAASGYTPAEHFLLIGGSLGWEASKHFNCSAYLEAYDDVKDSGINPLVHYLNFGIKEKRVAFESEIEIAALLDASRSKITVILDNLPSGLAPDHRRFRTALLVHAFYFDVFIEIYELSLKLDFSKLIVTTTAELEQKINLFLKRNCNINFRVSVVQSNKGRDIAPFLNDNVDNLFDFDLICKVHTKKSPHLDTFGQQWKRHLIQNMMGNRGTFNKVTSMFELNSKLGIAYPQSMAGTNNTDWALNKKIGRAIFKKLGKPITKIEEDNLRYPPASMFWFRPAAIKDLFHAYPYSEFPEEPIHFDGTLAHALERSFNFLCAKNGYEYLEYINLGALIDGECKESIILEWLNETAGKDRFIVVSHEATNTGAPKTALSVLKSLESKGKACLTILLNGGEQEGLFHKFGPVLNYAGQPLRESILRLFLENQSVNVICNTVVSYSAAEIFKSIGLPVISLIHEFLSGGHFRKEMFTSMIEHSDSVFYPAELVLRDTLDNIEGKPKNVRIMPQGIYDDSFPTGDRVRSRDQVISELGIPADSIIILSCGTIESRKGFDILTKVARLISSHKYYDKLHFIWVGKATENDPFFITCMADISNDLNIQGRLHILGAHSKVDKFFLASDIFALTSRFDPFPGVVLEAMASGMPIVCFDKTTGVHDAFRPDIGGYVCRHLDYEDMASKIMMLSDKPALIQAMGDRNTKRVREVYNFDNYTSKLLLQFQSFKELSSGDKKFSIIVPVFNTPPNYLQKMIQSVLNQSYTNLELCIADGSDSGLAENIISYYAKSDSRIKYISTKGIKGISGNTNAALGIATGDYLCFLDHDDTLSETALDELFKCIEAHDPDVIYTDEDKLDEYGLHSYAPVVKPDFDIAMLRKYNYITHLLCIKRDFFFAAIGKLDPKYDGAQDYDMVLRCAENTQKIVHLSKILYHWRVFESSTAKGSSSSKDYAVEAGRIALQDHFARQGHDVHVSLDTKEFRYVTSHNV